MENEKIPGSLSTLSRAQSEAITLAYLEGHTYMEVAGMLNLSLPAVKSRIGTAYATCASALARQVPDKSNRDGYPQSVISP